MRRKSVYPLRLFLVVAALSLGTCLAGCGRGLNSIPGVVTKSKNASEERTLTEAHVPGSGIEIRTRVGSVEIQADPARKDVQVVAKINSSGETEEEAKARLKEIQVKLSRRKDQVLEVVAEYPKGQQINLGGCSFVVHVPEATGVKARTANGSITLKGLAGTADADTGVGSIQVADQKGDVIAHTSNGVLNIRKVTGKVHADSNVGQVTVKDVAGSVTAQSGNGTVEVDRAGGNVKAKAGVGALELEQTSGAVEAETGNGTISFTPAKGSKAAFSLKTGIGGVQVRLLPDAEGSIQASTGVGSITVRGPRKPQSVTGDKTSKKIVLTEKGPTSKIHTGNGSIMVTLE
jgi:hypothetical protein